MKRMVLPKFTTNDVCDDGGDGDSGDDDRGDATNSSYPNHKDHRRHHTTIHDDNGLYVHTETTKMKKRMMRNHGDGDDGDDDDDFLLHLQNLIHQFHQSVSLEWLDRLAVGVSSPAKR